MHDERIDAGLSYESSGLYQASSSIATAKGRLSTLKHRIRSIFKRNEGQIMPSQEEVTDPSGESRPSSSLVRANDHASVMNTKEPLQHGSIESLNLYLSSRIASFEHENPGPLFPLTEYGRTCFMRGCEEMHIECEDKTSKFVEHCGCTESEVDLRHHHIYNYDDFISPPEPTYISDPMSEPRNNLQIETRHSMEQPQYLSSKFSDWSDSDHLSSTSLSSSSASGSFEIYVGNVTSVRFASTFAISVQRPYSMSDTMENYQEREMNWWEARSV